MKIYTSLLSFLLFVSVLGINSAYAQYADQHYIAPSPWVYWTGAYEIVLSTEFSGAVNVSVTKSDGTPMVNTTVSQGNPVAFRFTGNPAGVLNHPINTILNDAGIMVTASQPVAVNVRNVTSDQVATGNCIDAKGNSSLTSFGNEGLGINFRLAYYRSDLNGVGYCYALPVVNCVMAIANGTDVILNGSVITTLNAGQSYIFIAPLGSLLEASGPIVVNSGAYVDSPQGCGDGVVDQVAPTSVLDTAYFVVRGLGTAGAATDLPEQTTIVATRAATNVTVNRYNATGGLIGTNNYFLATAGSFVSFHHGDGATQYSCSHIVGDKPIAVYAGSAVSCEVDMSFVPPVGPCAGSFRVETTNFKSYLNTTLPYNGYVLVEDPTAVVFMNGVNLESITAPRFQIGNTGYYMIRFNDSQIGFPANMLINSAERMNISIVQQGGGFSMSAFFSSFNQVLDPPTLAPNGTCGSATFTAEPGFAPYQWYLDEIAIPGATAQTYVATDSGFYSVAGTRPCGLTKPSLPVYFDDSLTTPDLTTTIPDTLKCNVPIVTLSASSITPGATYSWGGANTSSTYNVSTPGTYYVTVTEPINNCQIIDTLVVAQNLTPPNVTINPHGSLNCNNASINLVAASTTVGTSFNWGSGNVTNTRNVTLAGNYTVTATNGNNGCTATATTSVASIPLISLTETHVNVACFGASSGSINVTVSGGQAPFTYAWSNAAIAEDLVNIGAGTYTLTVTDNQTCNATIQVIVTQPAAALTLDTNKTQILCFGALTGAIDLIPTGGTAAYTYAWSNSATTQDLNGVAAGQYNVTVTDANSCSATLSATLTQPANALSAASIVTNVSCFSGNNGAINLSSIGGTGVYTFVWSNGPITEDISGLVAGNYTVTITDANGCTLTHSKTINQPTDVTLNLTPTAVGCFGQSTGGIVSTTSGGAVPYGYSWSNGAIAVNLVNVVAGTYTLTVTDANGCQESLSATVSQPLAALTLDTNKTNILCFGASTGAIDLIPQGGTTAYTFAWSNSAISQDLTGVAAGQYNVTVTDANNCTATLSATLTQPASALSATSVVVDVSCFGGNDGAIDVTPAGAAAPYGYSWSNTAASEDISGVIAGNYSVTITDANGCTLVHSKTIAQPSDVILTLTPTAVACFGDATGGITSTTNGGVGPYGYNWSNAAITANLANIVAGSYSLTVTDAQGCQKNSTISVTQPAAALTLDTNKTNILCFGAATGYIDLIPQGGTTAYSYTWSNSATSQDLSNIVAGQYGVTVTDANNCTATLSATLTEPASALSATSVVTDVNCFGGNDGAIDVIPAGGILPYAYSWSNSAISEDVVGVVAGNYSVTITDGNGCNITQTNTVLEPTQLTVSLAVNGIPCNTDTDADITSTASGGTPGYTFVWSNASVSPNVNGVGEGTYTLTVTDVNSCTVSESAVVTIPPAIGYTLAIEDVSCFGFNDGYVQLNSFGGTGNLNATWAGGEYPDNSFSGIAPGNYNIVLTDDNGCDTSIAITITEPLPISIDVLPIDTLRIGLVDTLETNVVTNPGSVSYYWEPSEGLDCDICPSTEVEVYWDTRYVVMLDNNGCQTTDTVWVYVNNEHILYIPNAFSPNGDGINDEYYVYAEGVKRVVWSVFDRWGEIVFTSADIDTGWDGTMKGKKLQPGVFVISVYIEFLDLTSERHQQSIVLLR
jgi:gliding motility-associated-like protein